MPASRATAAAAVVLQPLASIIALTRNGPKKVFWTAANRLSAVLDVGAAHPHRGVPEVGGPAREDRAVDQRRHVGSGHAAVAQHLVGAGVVGDDPVERARIPVRVELEEELLHARSRLAVRGGLGNRCGQG